MYPSAGCVPVHALLNVLSEIIGAVKPCLSPHIPARTTREGGWKVRFRFRGQGVLLLWLIVGQGPTAAAVGATGGIFIRSSQPRDGQAFPGYQGDVLSDANNFLRRVASRKNQGYILGDEHRSLPAHV